LILLAEKFTIPAINSGLKNGVRAFTSVPHQTRIYGPTIPRIYGWRTWIYFSCGYGEAINLKGEVSHTTIRGNRIYDIQPGIDGQYNEGAISLEGNHRSRQPDQPKGKLGGRQSHLQCGGGGWPHGITFFGNGNVIRNNTIEYVTGTGIRGNTWQDQGLLTYVYNNNVSNCGTNINIPSSMTVSFDDPGENPNNAANLVYLHRQPGPALFS
jgi:hypothetical protein